MNETRNIWKEIDKMYEDSLDEEKAKIKRDLAYRLRQRKMLRNR